MAENYSTAVSPGGVRVRASHPDTAADPWVQFDDDPPIPVPSFLLYPQVREVTTPAGPLTLCVGNGVDDRPLILVRSTPDVITQSPLKVRGTHNIHIRPQADPPGYDVSWVSADGYHLDHLDGRVTPLETPGEHPDGPHFPTEAVWNGRRVLVYHQPGWDLAEDAVLRGRHTRLYLRRTAEGDEATRLAFEGYTPNKAMLAVHPDGAATVAITLPADQATFFVRSRDMAAYRPPPVVVPERLAPTPHRRAILVDGGSDPTTPWFIAHNYLIPLDEQGHPVRPILGVLHHHHDTADQGKTHLALAAQWRVPFYRYADTPAPTRAHFAFDVGATPTINLGAAYLIRGETADAFQRRVEAIGTLLGGPARPYGLYVRAFLDADTDAPQDLQSVIDAAAIVAEVIADDPLCRIVVLFTARRSPIDGVEVIAELGELARVFRATSPNPDDIPTVAEIASPAPPVDDPDDPDEDDPHIPEDQTPPPPAAPAPPADLEVLMTGGGITLMASKFVPSTVLPGRFNYRNDDGSFLSVDGTGTVTATRQDNGNSAFQWTKGSGIARVWPDPQPFAVKVTFLVDEAD